MDKIVIDPRQVDAVRTSWLDRKKIQVIKIVRELTGLGLQEAKDKVDNCWGMEWTDLFVPQDPLVVLIATDLQLIEARAQVKGFEQEVKGLDDQLQEVQERLRDAEVAAERVNTLVYQLQEANADILRMRTRMDIACDVLGEDQDV